MSEEKKANSGSNAAGGIGGGLFIMFLCYSCVNGMNRSPVVPPPVNPITYTSTTPSWQATGKSTTPSWNLPDKSTAGLPTRPTLPDLLKAKEKSGGSDTAKVDTNQKISTDPLAGGKAQPKTGGSGVLSEEKKAKPKLKVIVAQEDAELLIGGKVEKRTGTVREFGMPELEVGKQYEYKLSATWKPSTSTATLTCSKTVPFKGGDDVEVDLTKPDPSLNADLAKEVALPEKATAASGLDEELLILFLIEHYFASLEDAPGPEVVNRLVVARKRLVELMARAKVAGHDKLLIELCQDMRDGIDSIFTFLENIGAIERGLADRASTDKATAAYNAGYLGGSAYAEGASGGEAILAAGLLYFLQESAAESRRDAAKQAAFKRENDRMKSAVEDSDTKVKVKLAALAEKKKWSREVLDSNTPPDIKKAKQANDIAKLKSHYEEMCKKQPMNPFPKAELLRLQSLDPNATPETLLKLGKECFLTTTWFPDNTFYDAVKAEVVFNAASIMDRGLDKAVSKKMRIEATVFDACHDYWKVAMQLGGDPQGIVRENMMWQLTKHDRFEAAQTI